MGCSRVKITSLIRDRDDITEAFQTTSLTALISELWYREKKEGGFLYTASQGASSFCSGVDTRGRHFPENKLVHKTPRKITVDTKGRAIAISQIDTAELCKGSKGTRGRGAVPTEHDFRNRECELHLTLLLPYFCRSRAPRDHYSWCAY